MDEKIFQNDCIRLVDGKPKPYVEKQVSDNKGIMVGETEGGRKVLIFNKEGTPTDLFQLIKKLLGKDETENVDSIGIVVCYHYWGKIIPGM